ncbi:hypothetical protein [Aeromicrobium duanguangcaii]|uniref:hypothetical protein n=1 Tax=Aeromicrobium duanguangcaii TaxID=2968086 RepID=UPI0020176AFE|nr:hypothetical protein [Aeromicrobium duanguangcaii]MCL3837167.1 hypothetical protein [Aeromicrobium duanguangcaii]
MDRATCSQALLTLLREYQRADNTGRTPILRRIAETIVDLRATVERPDGSPDWKGRTHTYRSVVRDAYAESGMPQEVVATVQAAVRYHVGALLRERLDEETLQAYGLHRETPREKSKARRESRNLVVHMAAAEVDRLETLGVLWGAVRLVSSLDAMVLADGDTAVAVTLLDQLQDHVDEVRAALHSASPVPS